MKPEKVKELLYRTIEIIPELEIQRYVREAFDASPKEFFQAPTSSTGKYHPPENNIIGGLTGVHTIKTALYGHDFSARTFPDKKGIVIAACLLHDIRKGVQDNGEWKGYALDHGLKAYNWLEQFDLNPLQKNPIRDCVRTHMHDLTNPEEEKILACSKDLPEIQRIVQYADIAASIVWASFIPGVNVRSLLELRVSDADISIDELVNQSSLENAISKLWGNQKRVNK